VRKKQRISKQNKRERDEHTFYVCRHTLYDFMFHAMLSDAGSRRLANELAERITSTPKHKYQGDAEARRFLQSVIKYLRGKRGLF
jgi:hypothetical protein